MAASLDDAVTALKNLVVATNNLSQVMTKALPVVQSMATTATAGTNGAPPAQVYQYLNITLPDGTPGKVAVYKP